MKESVELPPSIPNGAAAAAIVAAGWGCFAIGALGWLGDAVPSLKPFLTFYKPTGPLSGVTTLGLLAWLLAWALLARLWSGKSVPMRTKNVLAFALLLAGFLLTFPPFGDLLMRK